MEKKVGNFYSFQEYERVSSEMLASGNPRLYYDDTQTRKWKYENGDILEIQATLKSIRWRLTTTDWMGVPSIFHAYVMEIQPPRETVEGWIMPT